MSHQRTLNFSVRRLLRNLEECLRQIQTNLNYNLLYFLLLSFSFCLGLLFVSMIVYPLLIYFECYLYFSVLILLLSGIFELDQNLVPTLSILENSQVEN